MEEIVCGLDVPTRRLLAPASALDPGGEPTAFLQVRILFDFRTDDEEGTEEGPLNYLGMEASITAEHSPHIAEFDQDEWPRALSLAAWV